MSPPGVLRSLIFNILFYGVTVLLALLVLPSLLLPAAVIRAAARLWGWITVQTLRIAGGTHRLSGELHLDRQVIYAAKHQSAWETVVLALILHTPMVVLNANCCACRFGAVFPAGCTLSTGRPA